MFSVQPTEQNLIQTQDSRTTLFYKQTKIRIHCEPKYTCCKAILKRLANKQNFNKKVVFIGYGRSCTYRAVQGVGPVRFQIDPSQQSTVLPITSLKPRLDTTTLYSHKIFVSEASAIVLDWAGYTSKLARSENLLYHCFESCENMPPCSNFHRDDKVLNFLMFIYLYNRTSHS